MNVYSVIVIALILLFCLLSVLLIRACDKANQVDWGGPWLNRIDGLLRLFCRYYHGLQSTAVDLPKQGAALVVANHVSGLDPLLMLAASSRRLHFIIAREEYQRFGLRWLFDKAGCSPVDRDRNPERALREAIRVLQAGRIVALFPQGGIQKPGHPKRVLKAGVVYLAKKIPCPIMTMHISGIHPRALGKSLPAILIPSSAQIVGQTPIDCSELDKEACLTELKNRILPAAT